jgi:hypothetical protein
VPKAKASCQSVIQYRQFSFGNHKADSKSDPNTNAFGWGRNVFPSYFHTVRDGISAASLCCSSIVSARGLAALSVEQSAIQVERLVGAFELLGYLPTSCLQRHVCPRLAEH